MQTTSRADVAVYEICDLTKVYGRQTFAANDGINLEIQAGEIFGLLGDNGAGKTTLVRQMVNLLSPTLGSISLYGRPVACAPQYVARYVGYMPQEPHALNTMTVAEALYFTAHLRGLSRSDARHECEELIASWQLETLRNRNSNRLSGGERRLLRLAAAMAGRLPVLILDEPTNELAPQRRRLVWDNLTTLNRERGTTIIFITHDAIEAEKVIQRVGILRQGKLVVVGRPSDLKKAVDRKLRLEMFTEPGVIPHLPDGVVCDERQPGRWIALIDRETASQVLGLLNLDQFEDFRLYTATLEDLYVHYAV